MEPHQQGKEGFSRAFPGFSRAFPGRWLPGAGRDVLGQQPRGDAGTAHERQGSAQSRRCPSPAQGPGCHCSATGAAAAVVRLAQPLLCYAQGHTLTHTHPPNSQFTLTEKQQGQTQGASRGTDGTRCLQSVTGINQKLFSLPSYKTQHKTTKLAQASRYQTGEVATKIQARKDNPAVCGL